jgi:transcription antitermination factor NusA-like protein
MKGPICETCAKSGFLCQGCESRLAKGEISQADIEATRLLYELEANQTIPETEFERSIELDGLLLLLVRGRVAALIGKGGRVVRMLSEKLGRKVRIIGAGDERTMIRDLVFPARIFGMNVLHTKEGEEYTVVIPEEDRKKLVISEESLKKAVSVLSSKKINISFG